jgi:hypothetical protein
VQTSARVMASEPVCQRLDRLEQEWLAQGVHDHATAGGESASAGVVE